MLIEALLDNGVHNLRDLDIAARQHLPAIRRIYVDSGLDDAPLSDSLYDQLLGMVSNYFAIVLPPAVATSDVTATDNL